MDSNADSSDRRTGEYVLFALAFIGFMLGLGGVVVAAPFVAVIGFFLLLFSMLAYQLGPSADL